MAPVNADADTVPSNIANDAERTMDLTELFPLTEASPIHMFSGLSFPGPAQETFVAEHSPRMDGRNLSGQIPFRQQAKAPSPDGIRAS
jgi:hypothetical protein